MLGVTFGSFVGESLDLALSIVLGIKLGLLLLREILGEAVCVMVGETRSIEALKDSAKKSIKHRVLVHCTLIKAYRLVR